VDTFVLPGNVTAYTDAPIYARTDGYLVRWYFDIGAKVKKGALLAGDRHARGGPATGAGRGRPGYRAGHRQQSPRIQADRYTGLVKSDAVSQQDTDTFVNQATATARRSLRAGQCAAAAGAAIFEKVYAPFDGVVTARNVDTGQLINQGRRTSSFTCRPSQPCASIRMCPRFMRRPCSAA
jgi:multidrug efflux pump subunit AcrA (membrane-fusion protein)